MSALALVKASGRTAVCLEPGCTKSGRYEVHMLGTKLKRDARLRQNPIPDTLCPEHAEKWAAMWAELSGAEQPGAVAA